MILLIAKSGNQLPDHPRIGTLVTPSNGAVPGQRVWAADNEAFSRFDPGRFKAMLDRLMAYPAHTCRFVTVPDVVGHHGQTMRRWGRWAPLVGDYALPLGFVAQDGCRPGDVPAEASAVFIGGSTDWKLGPAARAIVLEARATGRWVHVGRVNSARRARLVASWGAQSIDGSAMSWFTNERTPRILAATEHVQGSLH